MSWSAVPQEVSSARHPPVLKALEVTGCDDAHAQPFLNAGIGRETALCFKQLGCRVTAHYNTAPKGIDQEPGLVALQANVTSEADVKSLFEQARVQNGGPVQVLIVSHGIWPVAPVALADMSLDQWRNTHAVNLDGAFLLVREYLSALKGQPAHVLDKASICMVGSTAGKFGEHDHGDYASTKSALMYGLVPTLKNEIVRIAPKGRVNSVNPGWVLTPMAEETIKDDKIRARALAR